MTNGKNTYFWLSFADPDAPQGIQFLGVIITKAVNITDAIKNTWKLKINPGGQIEYIQIPNRIIHQKINTNDIDHLLDEDKAMRYAKSL